MELFRTKNASTYITVPLVSTSGSTVTSASSLDSEFTYFSDLSAPISMADCTNEAAEIAGEGIYRLQLVSTEMNHDYIYVQIKTPMAVTQHILLNTKLATVSDIWNEPISQHSAVGVVGKALYDVDINTLSLVVDVGALAADHASMMIDVDSILANVQMGFVSTMIGVASLLANQVLWGTSSGIAVRSVASQIATMQIENTSILANVQTGFVSTMIGVASLLANQTLWGTSSGIAIRSVASQIATMQIDVSSTLSNVKSGDISILISTASILANVNLWGVSNAIATASINANVLLFGTSTAIGVASLIANIRTMASHITDMTQDDGGIWQWTANALELAPASSGASSSLTYAGIADAVWDEALSQHSAVGVAGAYLFSAGGAADPWNTSLPGAYAAGTAGVIIASIKVDTASVLANQTLWGTSSGIAIRSVASQIATMQIDVSSTLSNVKTGFVSTMIGIASLISSTSAIYAVVDNNNDRLEALRIDHVSLGINVLAVDTVVDAIKIETASILSTLDTAQIDVTSLVVHIVDLDGRIPAALVTGRIDANVGGVAAGAITSSAISGDAYDTIADEVLDEAYEGTETLRQNLRLTRAFQLGMASGGGTNTQHFFSKDGLTERVTMQTDATGNRSIVSTIAT